MLCFSFPGFWSLVWSVFFVAGFGIRVICCHAPSIIKIWLLIRLGRSEPYLVCHLAAVLCFFSSLDFGRLYGVFLFEGLELG